MYKNTKKLLTVRKFRSNISVYGKSVQKNKEVSNMARNEESNEFYFEVRNERGKLQATFSRRWEAEKYAEGHENLTVTKIDAQ